MKYEKSIEHLKPELLSEWDYSKNVKLPKEVNATSHDRISWICKGCGHKWATQVYHRYYGSGCPQCSRKRTKKGCNDLKTLRPDLAEEWDYELNKKDINKISLHANYKAHWKCKKGHKWEQLVSSRVARGSNCPYCSGKRITVGVNSFADLYPDLVKELNDDTINPYQLSAYSHRKVSWKCDMGHVWEASIIHRTSDKSGCPYCKGLKVVSGINDFATLYPYLLDEWDYELNKKNPTTIGSASVKKFYWKCKKGHRWQTSIAHRTKRNSQCPYCCGQKAITGETDLATTRPDLVEEWDYAKNRQLTPNMVMAGSDKKVWWTCENGHSWRASLSHRKNGTGCPYCARLRS